MGKSRSERRLSAGEFNIYGATTHAGWQIVRQATLEQAAERVAAGDWREVFYEDTGELAGFQMLPARSTWKPELALPDMHATPATITIVESQMNAGLFGRSRTLGMPEWKRKTRHGKYDEGKILDPEDAIERAVVKVRLWPYPASVGGDRAVRVYPKTN